MIIAIDGIAASGKSTIGKLLARRLGFGFLDTGLLYRLLTSRFIEKYPSKVATVSTLFADDQFVDTFIQNDLTGIQWKVDPKADDDSIMAFGKNYAGSLNSAQISKCVPYVAAHPHIREFVRTIQRQIAGNQDIVMVGRDIGTVVFPDADYQFFITVDDKTRAQRRLLQTTPEDHVSNQVLDDMVKLLKERDALDRERENSPLVRSPSAIIIDNSTEQLDVVVEKMIHTVAPK